MYKNRLVALTIAQFLIPLTALAQEDYTRFKSDITVQALGSFVTQTTQNGVQQSATDSGGVLATYRRFFSRHNGFEANYAWTSDTQQYGTSGVSDNSHEASAAYVFRMPLRRWSPFVLAGAGALIFDPANVAGASTQTRAAFVYGGGADFNLSGHVFVRAEYRGLFYDSPTYNLPAFNGLDRVTHRAEPSVGFGWRF
jgi:opacity protein-like surface antigen